MFVRPLQVWVTTLIKFHAVCSFWLPFHLCLVFLWQDFSLLNVLLPLYSRCPALNKFSQLPSSNRGSETPALSQLLSNRGVHFNNLKGFVYPRSLVFTPRFPIWWPGVQSYLTPHSGSMLMSWLWDSYLEKISVFTEVGLHQCDNHYNWQRHRAIKAVSF